MTPKVKSIAFKIRLKGSGGVNYDDAKLQVSFFKNQRHRPGDQLQDKSNYSLHKGNYYAETEVQPDGSIKTYFVKKLKISSNCLRNAIFAKAHPICNAQLHLDPRFVSFIASPSAQLRGYMYPIKNGVTVVRSSPISIRSAEQISNTVSTLEVMTKHDVQLGVSNGVNPDAIRKPSDTSMFSKETFGDITYEATGVLNLGELGFICFDDRYLRMNCTEDNAAAYIKEIENRYGPGAQYGYFEKRGSEIKSMELGLQLTSDQVQQLARYFFERVLDIDIVRSSGYAAVESVMIKYIYDGDLISHVLAPDATDWLPLTSPNDLSFTAAPGYAYVDRPIADAWLEEQKAIDDVRLANAVEKTTVKAAKKQEKKDRIAKKRAEREQANA